MTWIMWIKTFPHKIVCSIYRQQLPLVIGFFADYALEELLKVCLWIDAVEPATLRQRKDEGRIFSSILTSYILEVLQVQFYRFHSLFTEIVWYLHPAVLDEVLKWLSLIEHIIDSIAHHLVCHQFQVSRHQYNSVMYPPVYCLRPSLPSHFNLIGS